MWRRSPGPSLPPPPHPPPQIKPPRWQSKWMRKQKSKLSNTFNFAWFPYPAPNAPPETAYDCSRPEALLEKRLLKICTKFAGDHPPRSVISIKLQSNFIEIVLRHGRPSVNLLHIFRTPFPKNTWAAASASP